MDVGRNPGQYVATAAQQDAKGRVVLLVLNRAPVALIDIYVTPLLVDAAGRIAQQGKAVRIGRSLAPGEQFAMDPGVGTLSPEQLPLLRFRVDRARAVEP